MPLDSLKIFGSINPLRLNTDPEPWVGVHDGRRISRNATQAQERLKRYQPRSEYVPTLTHPFNPVLDGFRQYARIRGLTREVIQDWIDALEDPESTLPEIQDELDDAIGFALGPGWEDVQWQKARNLIAHTLTVLYRLKVFLDI